MEITTKKCRVLFLTLIILNIFYSAFAQTSQNIIDNKSINSTTTNTEQLVLKTGHFIPDVVNYNQSGNIKFQAIITGGEPSEIYLQIDGLKHYLTNLGQNEGYGPEGIVYQVSLDAQSLISKLVENDVYRVFVGYLYIFRNGQQIARYNEFLQIWNENLPLVEINESPGGLFFSENIVNVVADVNVDNYDASTITKCVYQDFSDNYDFISIVLIPGFNANRSFSSVKNEIQGIGISNYDNSDYYGSEGKLKGIIRFPLPDFFDLGSQTISHEIGHKWINFLYGTPYESGIPHWPYCPQANGIMGFSIGGQGGAGGTFPYILTHNGDVFKFIPEDSPNNGRIFYDIDLYLIGMLPPENVTDKYIFKYSDSIPEINYPYSLNDFIKYSIEDLIDKVGERKPTYRDSQKKFNMLTIVVSPEPLTSIQFSFYDYFAKRSSSKEKLAIHEGFNKGLENPFYLATQGLGEIDSKIATFTGINEIPQSDIKFYPNPVVDILKVETNISGFIEIINSIGTVILKQRMQAPNDYINVTTLPSGFYLIKVTQNSSRCRVFSVIKE